MSLLAIETDFPRPSILETESEQNSIEDRVMISHPNIAG